MDESTIFKKVFGCIIGGAIGDALGAPVEGCHYKQIQETYDVLREFVPPFQGERKGTKRFPSGKEPRWRRSSVPNLPFGIGGYQVGMGKYTDDMQGRLLNYLAIIKYGRRIAIWERDASVRQFALENVNHPDKFRREWARHIITAPTIRLGLREPVFGLGWGSPGGVINAGNPEAGAEDGGPLGAAVAEAFKPDATVDSVIQAALDHADSYAYASNDDGDDWYLADAFYRRTLWVLDLADKVGDVLEIRKYLYGEDPTDTFLVAFPPWTLVYPLEMFPLSLALIKIAKGDPWTAIVGGANFGRDCDSIACMAGEIAGAFRGVDALPKHIVEAVQEANPDPDMKEIAEKLTQIILCDREKQNAPEGKKTR